MTKRFLFLLAPTFVFVSFVSVAKGQYGADQSSLYGTMTQTNMSNIVQMTWGGNLMGKKSSKKPVKTIPAKQPSTTTKTPSNTTSSAALTFRSVAPSIMPQKMASKLSANNPANKSKYQRSFQQMLDGYHQRLRQKNGNMNDLARAISFFIYSNYTVATGKQVTAEQADTGREQVREALLENEDFQNLSDGEKQERYEGLIILGEFVMFYDYLSNQEKDQNLKAKIQKMAQQNLESFFGTSYKNVKITDRGIEL